MSAHNTHGLARFLTRFSFGLGLSQVLAPDAVNRLIGIYTSDRTAAVMRGLGFRELTAGFGLIRGRNTSGWLWARTVGDVMDLGLLVAALRNPANNSRRVGGATAAAAGAAALDALAAARTAKSGQTGEPAEATRAITVNRSREDVYAYCTTSRTFRRSCTTWRRSATNGDRRSHWTAKAPAGRTVEWDAEVTHDLANELISWRSLRGADVPNFGSVRFSPAPGDRGTEVKVTVHYDLPAGRLGKAVAGLLGESPEQQVTDDLRRFKQVMETGQVVRSEGSPQGTSAKQLMRQHPGQPMGEDSE